MTLPYSLAASLLAATSLTSASMADDAYQERRFEFTYQDLNYVGEVMQPMTPAKGVIVIIPGHGPTDFVEGDDWLGEREFFVEQGYAVAYWDKAGTGLSEGEYNHNQSIESSADEAVQALAAIQAMNLPNADNLGMWGISRAGWIIPQITSLTDDVKFWISVSGTTVTVNERYSLEANLRALGRDEDYIALMISEWDDYQRILVRGGTLEEYNAKTANLMQDPYYNSNNFVMTEEGLANIQGYFQSGDIAFDQVTNEAILGPNLEQQLTELSIPVLALLGRLDSQIDWQAVGELYEEMAAAGSMSLTTVYLDNCNHVMQQAVTGARNEELPPGTPECAGYFETMESWLGNLPAEH